MLKHHPSSVVIAMSHYLHQIHVYHIERFAKYAYETDCLVDHCELINGQACGLRASSQ